MLSDDAVARLVDQYVSAWNLPTPEGRTAALAACWAPEGTYTDPRADTRGIPALVEHIGRIQAQRPGAKVIRTSTVDRHHTVLRFHWCVELPDGSRLPEGIDFGEITPEGKLAKIVGFFGPLKAG